jgi:hypothetical protein
MVAFNTNSANVVSVTSSREAIEVPRVIIFITCLPSRRLFPRRLGELGFAKHDANCSLFSEGGVIDPR